MSDSAFKKLCTICAELNDQSLQSLLDYAGYLQSQQGESEEQAQIPESIEEPVNIPRPETETVVAAIKRLRETYPMLDSKHMLNDATSLMSQHVLQGRAAEDVISDLEILFEKQYTEYTVTIKG
jgi:hypothetical protein